MIFKNCKQIPQISIKGIGWCDKIEGDKEYK